jgi:MFS family permease
MSKNIFYIGLGTSLEWYDFGLFSLLGKTIATLYFHIENHEIATMVGFSLVGIAYFFKPIGGMVFSYIGDKHGRKIAITISSLIIAFTLFFQGLLPSYQKIGVLAPILVLACRAFQGISLGGEYSGSITAILEQANSSKFRGAFGTLSYVFSTIGFFFSLLISNLLINDLSYENLLAWGWRIPFFIGGILGVIFFLIRLSISESDTYVKLKEDKKTLKNPTFYTLKNWKSLVPMLFFFSFTLFLLLYLSS